MAELDYFLALGGEPVAELSLKIGELGGWTASVKMFEESNIAGATVLTVGDTECPCFVQTSREYQFSQHLVVTGGVGNILQPLPSRSYRSEGGVNPVEVAKDIINESGGVLGDTAALTLLHTSYTRDAGTVGECLTALGAWYVDFSGVVHFGARPTSTFEYLVRGVDAFEEFLEVQIDDLETIQPGAQITTEDGGVYVAREIRYVFRGGEEGEEAEGGSQGVAQVITRSTLVERLRSLANLGAPLHGVYSYIVESASGGKIGVRRNSNDGKLPDFLPIEEFPGITGCQNTPETGTECLVSFIDGRRDRPVIMGYRGSTSGVDVALKGSTVKVYLGPLPVVGTVTISGSPSAFAGTIATPAAVYGIIQDGTSAVKLEKK